MAAILDFWRTSTSHEIGSTAIRKLDPENMGIAVGFMSLCALELEICLGVFLHPLSPLPVNVAKTVAGRRVNEVASHGVAERT